MTPLSPAGPVPQLDGKALDRLRELDPDGRHGVLLRVLTAFETSLQRMLVQLRAGHEAGQPTVVSGVAHALKSSSASVGAMSLSQACAEVEARLRSGDYSRLHGDVSRLISEGESALAAVATILRA